MLYNKVYTTQNKQTNKQTVNPSVTIYTVYNREISHVFTCNDNDFPFGSEVEKNKSHCVYILIIIIIIPLSLLMTNHFKHSPFP